jgi:Cu(I)/Ag(I) efflux system membrane fusion protein
MTKVWIAALVIASAVVSALAVSIYKQRSESGPVKAPARTVLYYRDPMHPSYTSPRPGKAPDCGMELEPVYADEGNTEAGRNAPAMPGVIKVSRDQQQMMGLRVAMVEKSAATGTLRTVGRVLAEEDRTFSVTAGGEGWVTQVLPGTTTGDLVKKGQALAVVYGRDYATAQRTFLYALRSLESSRGANLGDYQDQPAVVLREARLVLQNMGFGDAQIEQLEKTRQIVLDIKLTSPADGVIVVRDVSQQKKFERGNELFRIADLSRVWISADLFGDEARNIRSGATAVVSLPDRPATKLRATVSEALSRFDAKSRTLKLRLEAENPGLVLRPDMFVNLEFAIRLPEAVTVPAESVVESGARKVVFVERVSGVFEPRTVETGWRLGGRVEILAGLKPGETIAVSGSFLLDSESRMKAGDANGHD